MDCNSLQTISTGQGAFAWHTTRSRLLAPFICGLLIVGPILNDLLRQHDNFSILYLVPILFCAWVGQKRLLRAVVVLCVVLTYVGLVLRHWLHPTPYLQWGALNRSIIVVALVTGWYLLEAMLDNLQQRAMWRPARMDEEHVIIEEVIFSSQGFAAIFSAVTVAGLVFLLDLFSPGQVNCPILYSLPLLMIVWTRSHVWLWIVVALTIVLAIVGWFVGAAPTISRSLLGVLEFNRGIAIAMLLVFGIIIHLATSNPYPKMDQRKISSDHVSE